MNKLGEILEKFPRIKRNALIPILQAVQDAYGYIPEEAIYEIGTHLSLPPSKVFGLATFYNQFTFNPKGSIHILVCNGSSCHLAGSGDLLGEIYKWLDIRDGQTTRDGRFSLEIQSCIGACGQSPVISFNGIYYTGVTLPELREIIKQYREEGHG
ncbi:MAG: NADH-quinone oxidoreductase subunit NuoE family protein [Bacteroidales bacterium]